MNKYEQFIWEKCGEPTKYWCGNCEDYKQNSVNCEYCDFPIAICLIDITLAHVLKLLFEKFRTELTVDYSGNYIDIAGYDHRDNEYTIDWLLTKENNEAAVFRDQSEETQKAICEVLGFKDD